MPSLLATVDTAAKMDINLVTVHLSMDSRVVSGLVLAEKRRALKELVQHGSKNHVVISLENLSESAADLEMALRSTSDLGLTLDVGHAQLFGPANTSFAILESLGRAIRHVHLHDNRGGSTQADDLHLPPGEVMIDFRAVLTALNGIGYQGTITLEVSARSLVSSRDCVESLVRDIQGLPDKASKKVPSSSARREV
jgi:sugar phosphate isomerase/epimerase